MGMLLMTGDNRDSETQVDIVTKEGYKVHQIELVRPSKPEDPNIKHFASIKH